MIAYCAFIAGVAAIIAMLGTLGKTEEMRWMIVAYWLSVTGYWAYRVVAG